MEDFDPGWVAADFYKLASTTFYIRSAHAGIADALGWQFARFRLPSTPHYAVPVDVYAPEEDADARDPQWSLFVANDRRFGSRSAVEVLVHALWDVYSHVPKLTRDFLILHAGAVERAGGTVLIPAASDSGKSSLVVGLLERGFAYVSDELGCIDPIGGRIFPFARPIKLDARGLDHFPGLEDRLDDRRGLAAGLPERFVRPEDVPAPVGGTAPAEMIVFPEPNFDGPPRLEPVSAADAVEHMAAAAFNLHRYGERGVILLSRIASGARAFRLTGGSSRARAELVAEAAG